MSKLRRIAEKMRAYAMDFPCVRPTPEHTVPLAGGLVISLWLTPEAWHLGLKRTEGKPPGERELETVREHFDVPEDAEKSDLLRQRKGDKLVMAYVITWKHSYDVTAQGTYAQVALPLVEPNPVAKGHNYVE